MESDDKGCILCLLSEKEEWYPHSKVDQLTIIRMKRRNTNINDCPSVHRHYNTTLGNNEGEQDDNNI